jgi:hypothetical protein
MARLVGRGPSFRQMALRLFVKFVGESMAQEEAARILAEGEPQVVSAAEMADNLRMRGEAEGV